MANKETTNASAPVDRVLEASTSPAGAGALGSGFFLGLGVVVGVVAGVASASHVAPPVAPLLRVNPALQVKSITAEVQVAALVRQAAQLAVPAAANVLPAQAAQEESTVADPAV